MYIEKELLAFIKNQNWPSVFIELDIAEGVEKDINKLENNNGYVRNSGVLTESCKTNISDRENKDTYAYWKKRFRKKSFSKDITDAGIPVGKKKVKVADTNAFGQVEFLGCTRKSKAKVTRKIAKVDNFWVVVMVVKDYWFQMLC